MLAVMTDIRVFSVNNYQHYTLFYKQRFYKQRQTETAKKNQANAKPLKLNFCYLKITHILHPRYHPKIKGHILISKQMNKSVCIHEIIRLIIMKMKMKNNLF